jgi:hypothetical protein
MAAVLPSTPASIDPEVRREIEHWFARRGVPQLIEGYSSEPAMDARAAPFISLWLILGTIRDWGTRPDWPIGLNVLGIVGTIGWMALVWTSMSRVRDRPPWTRPTTFDIVDIATIALLPALPAALIDGSLREAVTATLGALTGIGVIYIVVGFGLIEIGAWAIERLWLQVTHIVELVARTLPLLLILVVFLLFAAEMWEAAHEISWLELAAVLLLLLIVASLLVVSSFRRELARLEARDDAEAVVTDALDTPAAPLIRRRGAGPLAAARLTRLQRSNLTLLVAVPQLLQALAVGAVVLMFLVAFATLVIPAPVQEGWIGQPPRIVATFSLLGEERPISEELLVVSAVLAGIVGLYFCGLAITDPTYRSEGFDRELAEVRRLLAARAVYLEAARPPEGTR